LEDLETGQLITVALANGEADALVQEKRGAPPAQSE
jgi:hypothetical protein